MATLDDILALARPTQERQVVVPMLAAAIAAHAVLGDRATAEQLGEEIVEFANPHAYNRLRDAGESTRGLCAIGRLDLARALVPDERPRILRRWLMWETAQATIAEAEQRWEEARAGFERAEVGWTSFPHPYEAAHAAWGLARVAGVLGVDDEARDASARARDRFVGLGAHRCLAAVSAPST